MKRADLLKWSAAANAQPPVRAIPERAQPLRMLNIPAVSNLERHLLLCCKDQAEIDREVASVCRKLFGIEPADTENNLPVEYYNLPEYDPEKWRLHNLWVKYERQFETSDDLTDDETVELLARIMQHWLADVAQTIDLA